MQKLLLVYYHSENRATSQIWKILPNMVFPPICGGENGGMLSIRMQVILDSSFACPGSAPLWGEKKGEFRDWTRVQGPNWLSNIAPEVECYRFIVKKREQ